MALFESADVNQTNADLLIMAEKLDTVLDAVAPPFKLNYLLPHLQQQ